MREKLELDFAKGNGLVSVITQDAETGDVLMFAHMNADAFAETLRTGRAVYWSRTRGLWRKGEESGNHQDVREIRVDCDRDAVLLKVVQHGGAACHEGFPSCFYRRHEDGEWETTATRVFDPATVYKKK